jgi:hypothetical protein
MMPRGENIRDSYYNELYFLRVNQTTPNGIVMLSKGDFGGNVALMILSVGAEWTMKDKRG